MADAVDAAHEYGVKLAPLDEFQDLNGLVLAVPHRAYADLPGGKIFAMLKANGAIVDVKSMLRPDAVPDSLSYWSL